MPRRTRYVIRYSWAPDTRTFGSPMRMRRWIPSFVIRMGLSTPFSSVTDTTSSAIR
jgi:hypothetical protein